ncbi:MAG: TetR/AcrR family transcriptional regulator [Acidimicrobiia bacterium]
MSEVVERKREAKRQAILDAAVRLFAERGYNATRMADVAESLGLHKPALYYYFDSKEAVLVELIRTRVGTALDALRAIAASPRLPADKISEAVRTHLRVFHEHPHLYTVFNSEKLHAVSLEAAAIVDDLGRHYEKLWEDMLSEGVASGALRPDLDIPVTMKAILGQLNSTLSWFTADGRLTIEQLSDLYVELVILSVGRLPRAVASGGG